MYKERWPRPLRAPDTGESSGSGQEKDERKTEDGAEKIQQETRSSKEIASGVLNYLAERLGNSQRYNSDISEAQLGQELYDRFGVYDPDIVLKHWENIKESPAAIQSPVLKTFAEAGETDERFEHSYIHDTLVFVDTAWVPIRQRMVELDTTLDLERKKDLLATVKEEISKTIESRKYEIYAYRDNQPLKLSDLEYHANPMINSSHGSVHLDDIAESLQKANFDIKFREKLGTLDKSKLMEETLKYGAKGANLNHLKDIQATVGDILGLRDYEIPDFRLIPASVYEKQQTDKRILDEVGGIYEWINKRKVIIRSSAVYSEDAEDATGAGIYESVILEKEATLRDFLTKIKDVYKSVDSPEARRYRAEHGVVEEKMGLVVQEFVDCPPEDRGYVNTVVKNVPELMEIMYEGGLRPIIVKDRAMSAIVHGGRDTPIMHYEIDMNRKLSHEIENLALVMALIERHYGQPIQAEFLQPENEETSRKVTYLVQTRFLPRSFSEKRHFEFPQGEALFEGRSVGAFDLTLPVLSNRANNRSKTGVVIFESSKYFTIGEYSADRALPQSGGVVMLGPPIEGFGHIETLCAEKGIALVFSSAMPKQHNAMREMTSMYARHQQGVAVPIASLEGFTTLRIVGNGLEGKVYGVGDVNNQKREDFEDDGGL